MKRQLVLFALLGPYSCRVFSQTATWTQQLTDAIAAGIAKVPTRDVPKTTDWLQVGIGALGAILSLTSLLLLGWLAWKSAKAAEVSAESADLSAKAAKVSADVSSAAQRPRFILTAMEMHPAGEIDGGGKLDCKIEARLTNFGGTPAEVVRMKGRMIFDRNPPTEARYPPGSLKEQEDFGTVAKSNDTLTLTISLSLTEENLQALQRSETHLWVYGQVAYRDYLDEYWVTGFIGVLEWTAAPFIQALPMQFERPPTSANVRHFFYTRRDEIGEAESTGTTLTVQPNLTR